MVAGSLGTPSLSFSVPDLHAGNELIEDRTLNINALGAQANLATVGKAGANRRFDSDIHDQQSAKTMPGFLPPISSDTGREPCAAALLIISPGTRFASEGNGIDVLVGGQELASRIRAETMHHVINALGHAASIHHFAEQAWR